MAPIPFMNYNERAWAIDIISEINRYSSQRSKPIARAGGENTITGGAGSLFPDVLLFGNESGTVVLQGWELKMPDTPITDRALLDNAKTKANRLGLNSFIVWNVNEAALYLRDGSSGGFVHTKAWEPSGVRRRQDVFSSRSAWIDSLHKIIDDINDLLDYGQIKGASLDIAVSDTMILDYLERYVSGLATVIRGESQRNSLFEAALKVWWVENRHEHPGCDEFGAIARVNLINWINRILFAHFLKRFYSAANAIDSIQAGTNILEAIVLFDNISASCDFMNVFKPELGQEFLDDATWSGLKNLNSFLKDFRLDSIGQESFHRVIEGVLTYSRKKLAGQFSTPRLLADLLVRLAIKDRTKTVIDPCCGTGTIARSAYELKRKVGLGVSDALKNTWACDKFGFPLQLCSIALSDPLGMGEIVQTFKHDAFMLEPGEPIDFKDPRDGSVIQLNLPKFHTIVSNLPFVRFEDVAALNPVTGNIRGNIARECSDGRTLDRRADLYAYLILKLRELVEDDGRIGVITSNSWLAAEWGREFKELLFNCFNLRQVIISGEGRWFNNSDVVTTILLLEKPSPLSEDTNKISFIATKRKIEEWETFPGGVDHIATQILLEREDSTDFSIQRYTKPEIEDLERIGIGWNAFFADLSWMSQLAMHLVPVNIFFDIARGERRGWDPLFYPSVGHNIEPAYIKPVLKSARSIDGFIASADDEAFCCSESIAELESKEKHGALAWIANFENALNGVGRPLPTVLTRTGQHWYEMSPDTLADFVVSMNPDKRLCVHRLRNRSFVNQRLIRFTAKQAADVNLNICHALMNSTIGLFLIEAIGFGRGLGALDLNATKLSDHLHILDPRLISSHKKEKIIEAFEPLLKRNVLDITEEIQSSDRRQFDRMVLEAFGVASLQNAIYDSLGELFHIRQTARI